MHPNKKQTLQDINEELFFGMKHSADETEKSYRAFFDNCKEEFSQESFSVSPFGVYKARFITCLLIANGANYHKFKLGFKNPENMSSELELATGIAYSPFQKKGTSNFIPFENLNQKTGKIFQYLMESISTDLGEIESSFFDTDKQYFQKVMKLIQNAYFESMENKSSMTKICSFYPTYFLRQTEKNLMMMCSYMND